MDPNDFARLFRLDGVGQVLVTVETHEETEQPCLRFRIPDTDGIGLTVTLSYDFREGVTYQNQCQHVRDELANISEDKLPSAVQDLVRMRDCLLEGVS